MKPYRDLDVTVLVRTFRVPTGTKFISFGHTFGLSDWFPDKFERELTEGVVGFGPRLGYSKGEPFPIGLRDPFKEPCGSLRAWEGKGTPELDPPLTWQEAGPSTCCLPLGEVNPNLLADDTLLDLGEQLGQGEQLGVSEGYAEDIQIVGNINNGAFTSAGGIGAVAEFEEFGSQIDPAFSSFWPYGSFPVFVVYIVGLQNGTRSASELTGLVQIPNFADAEWRVVGSPIVSGQQTRRTLEYDGSNLNFTVRRNSAPGTLYLAFQSPGDWNGVDPIALDPIFSDGKWDESGAVCYVFPYPQ